MIVMMNIWMMLLLMIETERERERIKADEIRYEYWPMYLSLKNKFKGGIFKEKNKQIKCCGMFKKTKKIEIF
jgi:hypothetical protein